MATIRKRRGRWQVQVRHQGTPPLSRTFTLRDDAERWARHTETHIETKGLPPTRRQLAAITFADLLKRYRDEVVPSKRAATWETLYLDGVLRHAIASRSLADLSPSTFAELRDERLKAVCGSSVRRELAILQHLFSVARREWGLPLASNPLADIRKPSPNPHRTRRLNADEVERLCAALAKTRNPLVGPLFRFALATGMRRGELLAMRWQHLDVEKRTLAIPTTKNGHPRTIPLSPDAIAAVAEARGFDADLVFPMTANAVRLAWVRLARRAGINDLHFHDLRHEAVSRFFERGLSMPEVALISGHRDPRMLFRYTHPRAEEIARKLGRSPAG